MKIMNFYDSPDMDASLNKRKKRRGMLKLPERDPDSKVKRTDEGRAFHREGPIDGEGSSLGHRPLVVLTRRTKGTRQTKERVDVKLHIMVSKCDP